MPTQSHNYSVDLIQPEDFIWAVETAAVRMLTEEVKRPELVHVPTMYRIVQKMYLDKSCVVAKCGEEPVGVLGGILHPNLLNPNIATMSELIWFVLPEYRKTRVGAMLLSEYDKITSASPAHEGTLSLLKTSPVNFNSIEKKGFKVEEQGFRKIYKEM